MPPPSPQSILAGARKFELLRERRAGATLRSVLRIDGRFVAKKFSVPAHARRFPRPWIAEHACLRVLDGNGAPRSLGWFEESSPSGLVAWLVKEFVAGSPVDRFVPQDVPALALLMARIHAAKIVTDDANAANFLRDPGGAILFLDFGKARLHSRHGWRFDAAVGRELAKLRREGFCWDNALWSAFLPAYFAASRAAPSRRFRILFACAAATALRMARKTIQGKSPRS